MVVQIAMVQRSHRAATGAHSGMCKEPIYFWYPLVQGAISSGTGTAGNHLQEQERRQMSQGTAATATAIAANPTANPIIDGIEKVCPQPDPGNGYRLLSVAEIEYRRKVLTNYNVECVQAITAHWPEGTRLVSRYEYDGTDRQWGTMETNGLIARYWYRVPIDTPDMVTAGAAIAATLTPTIPADFDMHRAVEELRAYAFGE